MFSFFSKKKNIEVPKEEKQSFIQKIRSGLSKSSSKIASGINDIFFKRKLDKDSLAELEELLIIADIGVKTSAHIIAQLSKKKFEDEVDPDQIKEALAQIIEDELKIAEKPLIKSDAKPQIILVCGVNGNGKTTTIGKLSHNFVKEGKKVLIAACDTFRAAAVGQLEVWVERSGADIYMGKDAQDPASVAFAATEKALNENYDILMIDTAGRLHTKSNLMDELNKITRVIKKLIPEAPHETVLVLDATTGQNAVTQVEQFRNISGVSGLIVTKLDGTAKGGIVISLVRQFGLPIYAIGLGEQIDDLEPFEAREFARSLIGI